MRKSYSDSKRKLRFRRSSIYHTRAQREIMETPVINRGQTFVARQAHPTVRTIAKGKITRAAGNPATASYMGKIPIKQKTVGQ